MKKFYALLALPLVALSLVVADPAAAQAAPAPKAGVKGGFRMSVHSHSNPPTLFPVDQLPFGFVGGDSFSYSSRACGVMAPFNDLGLNFVPDYPGVDDDADGTAPVRHHVEGTVTGANGKTGTVEGMITSVLCVTVNGVRVESENTIVTLFKARFRQASDNQLKITGRFELSPGKSTGTFARIEGGGSIVASFTCLGHQRDPAQPTCAQLGQYTDFVAARGDLTKGPGDLVPGLIGHFSDPTIKPV